MAKKPRFFAGAPPEEGESMDGTQTPPTDTELELIYLIKERQYKAAIEAVARVPNINAPNPVNGATALHYAAARMSFPLLKALEAREDLNYAVKDKHGRYPSEVAIVSGHGDMGIELAKREKAYAEAHNIQLWPLPEPPGA